MIWFFQREEERLQIETTHDRATRTFELTIMGGDGTLGWRPYAPYDAILVAAASPEIPKPLLEQLAVGGRLVIPLGDKDRQVLTLVTRRDADQYDTTTLGDVRFVPLIGEHGFRT